MSLNTNRLATLVALPLLALFTLGCSSTSPFHRQFAQKVEAAHNADAWRAGDVLRTDITVAFSGGVPVDGTLYMETSGDERVRLELKDGSMLVWDGQDAWLSPADSTFEGGRFHVLTWSYFIALPYKLRDPGTRLTDDGTVTLEGRTLDSGYLAFGPDVGDSPDDWYRVLIDHTGMVHAAGYIVTFGKTDDPAAMPSSIVIYEDHRPVAGVPLPHKWRFYHWSRDKGIDGEPKGHVTLANAAFVPMNEAWFNEPDNARRLDLPQP